MKTFASLRALSMLSVMTCALLLAACGQNKVAEKPPEPGDTAVARVNGQVIWASDVKREAVAQGLISEGEPLDISSAQVTTHCLRHKHCPRSPH